MTVRHIQPQDQLQLANVIRSVFEEYDAPLVNTVYDDPRTEHVFLHHETYAIVFVKRVMNLKERERESEKRVYAYDQQGNNAERGAQVLGGEFWYI